MQNLDKYKVLLSFSIKKAVKQMDDGGIGFCVCVDSEGKVVGVITDGDFRRAVLRGENLEESVEKIINKDFYYVSNEHTRKELKEIFLNTVAQHIPVIESGFLVDIITEGNFSGIERNHSRAVLDNPVVIMAGGQGKRMDPITRILPKPLIPLGDDPMIVVVMDEFGKHGIKEFYVSLNEKDQMIKAYFSGRDLPYSIKYVEEKEPMGTAGALKHLANKFKAQFFVSNCDIIVRADYADILKFHNQRKYDLTLVASMREFVIPYGVCDIKNGGALIQIREKPRHNLLINTGLYLLEPKILNLIPENTSFDMTDLINKAHKAQYKVGVFPVSEKSWSDAGQWGEYVNTMKLFPL